MVKFCIHLCFLSLLITLCKKTKQNKKKLSLSARGECDEYIKDSHFASLMLLVSDWPVAFFLLRCYTRSLPSPSL